MSDEQRREAGCPAGNMSANFGSRTLGSVRLRVPLWRKGPDNEGAIYARPDRPLPAQNPDAGGSMRLSAFITMTMVFVSPLSVQRGDGQARVEVASIKVVNGPDDPRGLPCGLPYVERTGSRIWIPFSQVCGLMRVAYGRSDFQVVGVPGDTGVGPSNFFEVSVRLAGEAVPAMEEARVILGDLLAERFKLRAHRESREMPIYALVASNNGPRL